MKHKGKLLALLVFIISFLGLAYIYGNPWAGLSIRSAEISRDDYLDVAFIVTNTLDVPVVDIVAGVKMGNAHYTESPEDLDPRRDIRDRRLTKGTPCDFFNQGKSFSEEDLLNKNYVLIKKAELLESNDEFMVPSSFGVGGDMKAAFGIAISYRRKILGLVPSPFKSYQCQEFSSIRNKLIPLEKRS